MPSIDTLKNLVREEIIQRGEEGCDVAGQMERYETLRGREELMSLYSELQKLRVRADFPYLEPSHLTGIRACRRAESKRWDVKLDGAMLDRMHGAWLGRISGCMLGKAVEGWGHDDIKGYLTSIGEWPLVDYIPSVPEKEPQASGKNLRIYCSRGNWNHAVVDDDTNYTVLGLKIMEGRGPEFTTRNVADTWLANLPYASVYTAERRAYINLTDELPLEQVPVYLNPYREWIGAQIRADFWGYAAPGWPEKAAEFAYRDAALSHIKNGIYGEMFCAAAISAALVTDDIRGIIEAAANEIPANCRLAETIADCIRWKEECSGWEEAFAKMLETYYGKYNWVHTNNNLAIVLIGLLFDWPDFEKAITYAVAQGMDTDCNGATAGSIIGAALGAKALPEKWIGPLNGKLDTTVIGFPLMEIEELAKRTMKQAERVLA